MFCGLIKKYKKIGYYTSYVGSPEFQIDLLSHSGFIRLIATSSFNYVKLNQTPKHLGFCLTCRAQSSFTIMLLNNIKNNINESI
jgi:hypothetical protein